MPLIRHNTCSQIPFRPLTKDRGGNPWYLFADYLEQKTVQNPRAFLFRMAANQSTDYLRQHQTSFLPGKHRIVLQYSLQYIQKALLHCQRHLEDE